MIRLLAFCCVLLQSALSYAALSSAPVPLVMWSHSDFFKTDAPSASVMDMSGFNDVVTSLVTGSRSSRSSSSYLTSARTVPEAIVAFVAPEMSSASFLSTFSTTGNSILSKAKTSLSIPYMDRQNQLVSESLLSIMSSVAPSAQVIASELENHQEAAAHSGCDGLLAHLHDQAAVFSDTKPDLLLIQSSSAQAQESCMQRVNEYVNDQTKGNFVSFVTADSSSASVRTQFPTATRSTTTDNNNNNNNNNGIAALQAYSTVSSHQHMSTQSLSSLSSSSNLKVGATGVEYVTSNILAGLLLGFFILLMTLFGIYALMAVERPVRFANANINVAKLY